MSARNPTVNRVRGVALLLVLLYHSTDIVDWPNLFHGESGVDIFLLLSGFNLAVSCADLPATTFLRRRFFRIFPAYWCALALFVGLEAHFSGVRHSWPDLALHVTGLHGFARSQFLWGINDSFWFITLIVLCYALFLVVRRHLADAAFVIRAGSLATVALAVYYLSFGHLFNIPYLVARLPDFFIGLLAGQWAARRRLEFRPGFALAIALLLLAYISFTCSLQAYDLLLALGYLCAFVTLEPRMEGAAVGRWILGLLGFLGTYSYELYLLHQPLMRNYSRMVIVRWYGVASPSQAQLLTGMLAGLAVAALGAVALHRLVDFVSRHTWDRRAPLRG